MNIGDSMRITIFISALSGGGAERVVCNLANHLTGFGHQVEILTMAEDTPAEPLNDKIKHTPLLKNCERKNVLLNNLKRYLRLRKYMKEESVDAYVVMLPITILLMLGLSKITDAPIVVSERADPRQCSAGIQKLLRTLSSRATGFVFQTEEARQWYNPYIHGVKSVIIPNAINPIFLRPEYNGQHEKKIVAAGRLTEQKNFPLLIRAFAGIVEDFPEHKLVIYGQGGLKEELVALARNLRISDRVEFPGFIKNVQEELEKAQMFVLSSDYEGMPNALMEAMALGLPCVSTDCGGGGARFLIENGINGLLVPIRDEVTMAEAMRAILSDPEKAAELSKNARKIQETLAPEKIYGQWEAFIREISERG